MMRGTRRGHVRIKRDPGENLHQGAAPKFVSAPNVSAIRPPHGSTCSGRVTRPFSIRGIVHTGRPVGPVRVITGRDSRTEMTKESESWMLPRESFISSPSVVTNARCPAFSEIVKPGEKLPAPSGAAPADKNTVDV